MGNLLLFSLLTDPVVMALTAGFFLIMGLAVIPYIRTDVERNTIKRRLAIEPKQGKAAQGVASKPSIANRFAEKAAHFYASSDPTNLKMLRKRLVQAGFYEGNAVGLFFLSRFIFSIVFAVGAFFIIKTYDVALQGAMFWATLLGSFILGYKAPDIFIGKRIKRLRDQYSKGFPDFLDLMSVCANAGMSMEASLDRVSKELMDVYPNLGTNLAIACLEMRAGRQLEDTMLSLGERLGLEEVRAFATLLQQSKELGSSLSDALEIYSTDMRHKRMLIAEEKAYALPAKLSVPVTGCILPVVLIVAVLPVIVRFMAE
jgi:tight adherence protein C